MKHFSIYMKSALFSSQYVEKYEAPVAILFGVKNQIDCSLFGEFWGDNFSDIKIHLVGPGTETKELTAINAGSNW